MIEKTSRSIGFGREAAIVFTLKVSSLVLGLVLTMLLARLLGPVGFGVYSFIIALASLLILPAHAGLGTLLLRETATGYALKEWSRVRGIWVWCSRISFLASIVLLIIVGLSLYLMRDKLSTEQFSAASAGLLLIPFLIANTLRIAVMRGIGETIKGLFLEALLKPLILVAGVLFLSLISNLSSATALIMNVIATSTVVVVGFVWFAKLRSLEISLATPKFLHAFWISAVLPLAFLMGTQIFIKYTDVVMLGVLTTAGDVGQYRIAAQAAELVIFVLVGITMVMAPRIARLHALGSVDALQKLVSTAGRLSFSFALLIFGAFFVLAENMIGWVFGTEYIESVKPLLILAAGQVGVAFFGVAPSILKMTRNERSSLWVFSFAALLNVLLNATLIPRYGISGAAIATSFSLVVAHAALSITVKRSLDIQTIPFHIKIRKN